MYAFSVPQGWPAKLFIDAAKQGGQTGVGVAVHGVFDMGVTATVGGDEETTNRAKRSSVWRVRQR